jgi:tRNA 2-selenouridine synthase
MEWKDITPEEIDTVKGAVLIDVRSPGEFQDAHIPGAWNVPLLDDAERAAVGTVYKQEGPEKARDLAMRLVAPKIPSMIDAVERLAGSSPVIVYCWRGGMRSYAFATFLHLMKRPVYRLSGGYRAYRQMVLAKIGTFDFEGRVVWLHGHTGVGKTRILQEIGRRGYAVLDLEKLANHRGSAFGHIGLGPPHNQKTFDSLLYQALRQIAPGEPIVIEAESKRIGKVTLPASITAQKQKGTHILLYASRETRVNRLLEEYGQSEKSLEEEMKASIQAIGRRLGSERMHALLRLLEDHRLRDVALLLLEYYYDPQYAYAQSSYDVTYLEINAEDLSRAVDEICRILDCLRKRNGRNAVFHR